MKIIFYEIGETEEASLKAEISRHPELSGFRIIYTPNRLNESTMNAAVDAEFVSVFIDSIVDRKIIDGMRNAKLITTRSTGFDHIDHAYAKQKGIGTANVPAYGSRTVAEFAFALILGLSRRTLDAAHKIKSGQRFDVRGMRGLDLYGKTMGIIGTGRIGQNAAAIARGFGMDVLAFDAFPNQDAAAKIGFRYVALDELLSRSDVVSLHVPYNPDTKHLINKQTVMRMKPGSILVNTARGEICDTEALVMGIERKILSGVGLDVVEGEKSLKAGVSANPADKAAVEAFEKLNRMPEAFITPHMAFYTKEAQAEISRVTIENILAALRGAPQNLVP